MFVDSHASATPQMNVSMDDTMISINYYETSYDWSFKSMQGNVSLHYLMATSPQYMIPSQNMKMKKKICYMNMTFLANLQSDYASNSTMRSDRPEYDWKFVS